MPAAGQVPLPTLRPHRPPLPAPSQVPPHARQDQSPHQLSSKLMSLAAEYIFLGIYSWGGAFWVFAGIYPSTPGSFLPPGRPRKNQNT